MANRRRESWNWHILCSWAPKSLQTVTTAMKLKDACSLEKKIWQSYTACWKTETSLCKQTFDHISKLWFFPVVMYVCELDHKEGWAPKNWCFQIVVLEKTLESPLDCKEIKWINPEGNQPWIFTGRTDAEVPILWPPDVKSWLTGKDPDAGKYWRQKKKRVTETEMIRQHLWLNGYEFEQTPEK